MALKVTITLETPNPFFEQSLNNFQERSISVVEGGISLILHIIIYERAYNDIKITGNIYTYSHLQTDCFVLSELFSVARHAERSKPGSKPVQLYVRLSFRPLGHIYIYIQFLYLFYNSGGVKKAR